MSIFRQETLACPACRAKVEFETVHSINADRRPDLRDAILDRSFQAETCEKCGTGFRLEPRLTYYDLGRGQWLAIHPADEAANWQSLEAQAQATYDKAFGDAAPAAARLLGKRIVPRLVFGWAALREKLVAREADLDDREVELVKLALLRGAGPRLLGAGTELRLVAVEAEDLIMAWLDVPKDEAIEMLRVPRALYDGIAENDDGWQPLRQQLGDVFFVDMQRLLLKQAA